MSERSSLLKYKLAWDLLLVTTFLKRVSNDSLKELTLSLTMLMALFTGQTAQALVVLRQNDMEVQYNSITLNPSSPLQTKNPGQTVEFMTFEDLKLCVITLIQQNLVKTIAMWKGTDKLLLSFNRSHGAVTCATIRRLILMSPCV